MVDDQDRDQQSARDALADLEARVEAAIDDVRPKFRKAFEELDTRVDDAMDDVRPRLDRLIREVQPRLDGLLETLQARIAELRKDLETRAARRDEGDEPIAALPTTEGETPEGPAETEPTTPTD